MTLIKIRDSLIPEKSFPPHPLWGDRRYRAIPGLNSLGYRAPEFSRNPQERIVAIGAEEVFGAGIKSDDLFHQRIAKAIEQHRGGTAIAWNLGCPHASNEYIVRIVPYAIAELQPTLVLVHFAPSGRREYLSIAHELLMFAPDCRVAPSDPVEKELITSLEAVRNPFADLLSLWRAYRSVEVLLAGTEWYCSFSSPEEMEALFPYLDQERVVGAAIASPSLPPQIGADLSPHRHLFEIYSSAMKRSELRH